MIYDDLRSYVMSVIFNIMRLYEVQTTFQYKTIKSITQINKSAQTMISLQMEISLAHSLSQTL